MTVGGMGFIPERLLMMMMMMMMMISNNKAFTLDLDTWIVIYICIPPYWYTVMNTNTETNTYVHTAYKYIIKGHSPTQSFDFASQYDM